MGDDLSEKELDLLELIAAFPIVHLDGAVIDALVAKAFVLRVGAGDGTLLIAEKGWRVLSRQRPISLSN